MTAREPNPAMDAWIAEAKAVPVAEALARMPGLKRIGKQMEGPCPACGGKTRLWVDRAKDKWGCRHCQTGGRGALSLLMYVPGADFLTVCVDLAGPAPARLKAETPDAKAKREAAMAAAAARREEEAKAREAAEAARMAKERARAHAIFEDARPVREGDAVWLYWRFRRLDIAIPADIRHAPALDYWHNLNEDSPDPDARPDWRVVHTGPAMVAAARNGAGVLTGCHITWLDPALMQMGSAPIAAKGKAVICHPATGERLPAKKMRGETWGSAIRLTEARPFMMAGEGIETTATALSAYAGRGAIGAWVAMSLGHLSAMPASPETRAWLFLGDGDSDPKDTARALRAACANALARGAARASISMAPQGRDFNDLVMT
jgi:hypothetical protein